MLLVLESYWNDDLSDTTSVFPFIDGWSRLSKIPVAYRRYHNSKDLQHWIAEFTRHKQYNLCYIAGHGSGGRLSGLNNDINLAQLAMQTHQDELGRSVPKKGIYFGACEVGQRLKEFLSNCGDKIQWTGGYTCSVPWIESTLCDIKILQYFYEGRVKRTHHDGQQIMLTNDDGNILCETTPTLNKINKWIFEDYPLSKMFGLKLYTRD